MGKGFLLRGTLQPSLGSMTTVNRNASSSVKTKNPSSFQGKRQVYVPVNNRIPSSISVKRVSGGTR